MSMAQILKLKPAFTDDQAQALAGLFDEEAATKSDLEALRLQINGEIEKLKLELVGSDEKSRMELKSVDSSLRAEIDKLRLEVQRDLKATEARIIRWMVGQGAAIIGILFALLRFVDK